MMTNNEITNLSREYAEEVTKADAVDPDLSTSDLNGIKRDVAEYAEEVIRFLLRRFYFAEKSKVKEEYKNTKSYKSELEPFSRQSDCCSVKLRLLEYLFPDIRKKVKE